MVGRKLYVGNLAYQVSDADLEQLFSEFGTVQSAQVIQDRDTGRSKGFGFVEMGSDAEAQAAIQGLHDQEVNGRRLTVNEARPREPRAAAAVAAATAAAAVATAAAAAAVVAAAGAAVVIDPLRNTPRPVVAPARPALLGEPSSRETGNTEASRSGRPSGPDPNGAMFPGREEVEPPLAAPSFAGPSRSRPATPGSGDRARSR